jgi:DNA-binding protein WhiA
MSVSTEQKKEIIEYTYKSSCCRRAVLSGIIFAKGLAEDRKITLSVEKQEYAEFAAKLVQEFYGKMADIYRSPRGGRNVYISFESPSAAKYISEIENIEVAEIGNLVNLKCRNCISAFLRGVFLAAGRLSDPEKQYALEFTLGDRTDIFASVLANFDMTPRIYNRRGSKVLYFRREEDIESFYGHAGLNKIVFDFIERKITTLARRETQRYLNCVTNNYLKMTAVSERQLKIITRLHELQLLSSLPEELEKTARIRLEYPELSLASLSAKMVPSISKSGLSHRLKRIEEIGSELLGWTDCD